MTYVCPKCGKRYDKLPVFLKCIYCGYFAFVKERTAVKEVKTD
ncbi:MAG: hypothetical protein ARM1_0192 [Candidatus Micrarchaeota archaeon]|nr:MAG: hypothetical protein ARM1_0192 [Candidatus Micrarchaeota archaeon]